MELLDIHTHNSTAGDAIYNCGTAYTTGRSISIGIHPWHISDRWQNEFTGITGIADASNIVAIGECGLDTLKSPATLERQEEVFKAHIQLSERLRKPLIIHCVKAFDRLLALHRELEPQQAWILHGFRGKPQQDEQLLRAGLYISLGERFNPDSVKAIPTDRLFIESDESNRPLTEIYAAIATVKGISAETLAAHILHNAKRCGFAL